MDKTIRKIVTFLVIRITSSIHMSKIGAKTTFTNSFGFKIIFDLDEIEHYCAFVATGYAKSFAVNIHGLASIEYLHSP